MEFGFVEAGLARDEVMNVNQDILLQGRTKRIAFQYASVGGLRNESDRIEGASGKREVAEVKACERGCGKIHLRARNKKGVRRKSG
jgi:hypothetical protein